MECEYKDTNSNSIRPTALPLVLLQDSPDINVTTEIPGEVAYEIKCVINDCLESYNQGTIIGVNTNLKKLIEFIKKYDSFPANNDIIQSGLFEMCLDILKRDPDPDLRRTIVVVLYIFANGSYKYLNVIATESFEWAVENILRKIDDLFSNLLLVRISNLIMSKNSEISLIFKEFNMNLILPFIEFINTNSGTSEEYSEDCKMLYEQFPKDLENLENMNIQILEFVKLMANHSLNHDVWTICFESAHKLINRSFLVPTISAILFNLIYNIEDNDEEIQQKYEMLSQTEVIEFVNNNFFAERLHLFLYVIYFIFKFNANLELFSFNISNITDTYSQLLNGNIPYSSFNDKDDMLFIYTINNLIIKDNSLIEIPDVINFTSFIFNEKLDDFNYKDKKQAALLFCSCISINSEIFFSESGVTYENFLAFFDDFVSSFDFDFDVNDVKYDDMSDIEVVEKMIECLLGIYAFFEKHFQFELERLANSQCVLIIQQFIDKYGIFLGSDESAAISILIKGFVEKFPMKEEE